MIVDNTLTHARDFFQFDRKESGKLVIPDSLRLEKVVEGFLANGLFAYDEKGHHLTILEARTIPLYDVHAVAAPPVRGYGDTSVCFMDTTYHEPGIPDIPEARLCALLADMRKTIQFMQGNGNACFFGMNYSLPSMLWKTHPRFSQLNGGQTIPFFHPSVYTFDDSRFSNYSLTDARNNFTYDGVNDQKIHELNRLVSEDILRNSSFQRTDVKLDAMGFTFRAPISTEELCDVYQARALLGQLSLDVYSGMCRLNNALYRCSASDVAEYAMRCSEDPTITKEMIAAQMEEFYIPYPDWGNIPGGNQAQQLMENNVLLPGGSWFTTVRVPPSGSSDVRPEVMVTLCQTTHAIGHVQGAGISLSNKPQDASSVRQEELQCYYEALRDYVLS